MNDPKHQMPPYTVFFRKDEIIGIVNVHPVLLSYAQGSNLDWVTYVNEHVNRPTATFFDKQHF